MINIRPIRDLVLLKRFNLEQTSMMELPSEERSPYGKVLRTGPEVRTIQSGESVYFRRFSGHELSVNGECFLLLPEREILGVLVI